MEVIIWLALAVGYSYKLGSSNFLINILLICFFLFLAILAIRRVKICELYDDRLVIRRPLYFPLKTAEVFNFDRLTHIQIHIPADKLPGFQLHLYTKDGEFQHRIDFYKKELDNFIHILENSGVAIKLEN